MRCSFFLGAMALTLSGSALVPALAETRSSESTVLASASPVQTELAVREIEVLAPVESAPQPVAPPVRLAPVPAPAPRIASVSQGTASWYGPGFFGNRTASGEVFRPGTLTAAHRTLPFGTRVRVTNLNNGRSTIVRINDRGPFHGSRVIDLAHGAAHQLGVASSGLAPVRLEVLR
ncbi:MAG: septal ring lytic transglycosylase RlpA family protein [Cyanobacteriota bacterium]|nr:septal ring lytic transglycosylase RlpA family protein [Cyanobacteriota bacterium]